MKNLDLNVYGVQEMDTVEMKQTDGGWFWWFEVFMAGRGIIHTNSITKFYNVDENGNIYA